MAKGTYPVSEGTEAASAKDVSFRSCLCALLVFISICVIILLAGMKWTKDTIEEDVKKEVEMLELEGSKRRTTEDKARFVSKEFTRASSTTSATTSSPTPFTTSSTSSTSRQTTPTATTLKFMINTILETTTARQNSTTSSTTSTSIKSTQSSSSTTTTPKLKVIPLETATTPYPSTTEGTRLEFISNKTSAITNSYEDLGDLLTTKVETGTEVSMENATKQIDENATTETYYTEPETSTETVPPTTVLVKLPLVLTQSSSTTEESTSESMVARLILERNSTTSSSSSAKPKTTAEELGQRFVEDYEDYPFSIEENTTLEDYYTNAHSWYLLNSTTTEASTTFFTKLIEQPVCITPGCKSTASRILSLMNHSIDPCEDFYEFSCGGIQEEDKNLETWTRLLGQVYLIDKNSPAYLKKFRTFYDSCVSHEYQFDYEERLTKVLELVKEVGEVLDGEPAKNVDVTDLFSKLILRQSLPIMDVDVDIDKQSSKFIMKLTLPRKTSVLKASGRWSTLSEGQKRCLDERRDQLQDQNLDLTAVHESYLECQKNHAIYLNSIQTVVRSLGFYSHLKDTFNQTQRIQDLRTTIEWDILDHLNVLPPPNEVRKTVLSKDYTVQKISDLQVHYSFLEWDRLFKTLTGHEMMENNTLIQVYFSEYFTNLFAEMRKIPKWKINNALVAIYAHDLYENLLIPQAKNSRENYCVRLASKLFRDVSSNVYMKTWSKQAMEEAQKFMTKIFDRLKDNLADAVQKVEWLDDASRIPILSKLKNKISLTFNKREDLYNNETYLDLKYHNLELKPSEFIYNAVKMIETTRKMLYRLHGQSYSINYLWSYFLNAYDSRPTSFYTKGLIMAPLGMVRQPTKGVPEYITMARLGLSLAKEIGHHFDSVGIQHGMTLSTASKPSYDYFQKIMEDKSLFKGIRSVKQQEVRFEADPQLSVNERIADNTALRMISDITSELKDETLLPWISTSFSKEKIFFVATAQEYCRRMDMAQFMEQLFESEILPSSLRVENIMSSSKLFAKTFDCPIGSNMNNNPYSENVQFPYLQAIDDYNYENNSNDN